MAKDFVILGSRLVRTPLYVSDLEIAEIVLGERRDTWPSVFRRLEGEGFPEPSRMIRGLRYLPAVLTFFDRRELDKYSDTSFSIPDGEERFEL